MVFPRFFFSFFFLFLFFSLSEPGVLEIGRAQATAGVEWDFVYLFVLCGGVEV